MKEERIKYLLDRYYTDSYSEKDKEELYEYIRKHNNSFFSVEMKEKWDNDIEKGDVNLDRLLDGIHHKINLEDNVREDSERPNNRFISMISKVAAVLLIPLLIFNGIYFLGDISDNDESEEMYTEVHAPWGARSNFKLPDGSEIWLNSGSTLKYSQKSFKDNRAIELDGQAYFKVKKNVKNPFYVSAHGLLVKVLGTSFDVSAYKNESLISTTLVEGKVNIVSNINNKKINVNLNPNQRIEISKSGKATLKKVRTDLYTSWKDGRLIFKNTPMSEVVRKLERWYNYKIEIHDNDLKKLKYTATIEMETLTEVLELMKITASVDYSITKRNVVIIKNKR